VRPPDSPRAINDACAIAWPTAKCATTCPASWTAAMRSSSGDRLAERFLVNLDIQLGYAGL
jgi:hypothetical protein